MSWFEFLDFAGQFIKGAAWMFVPALTLPVIRLILPKSSWLKKLAAIITVLIDSLVNGLGEIIKWAIPAMVFVVAFAVFADAIFGLAWTKLYESGIYLHAFTIMLGSAAALLAGQHVRVDIFHTRMSARKKARIDLWGFYILLMPLSLVILWYSQGFVKSSWQTFEGFAEADSFRALHLMKSSIPVFCVTMLAQGLAISLRAINVLNYEDEPALPKRIKLLFSEQETHHGP